MTKTKSPKKRYVTGTSLANPVLPTPGPHYAMLKNPTAERMRIVDGLVCEHIFGWRWFSADGDAFLIPPFAQAEFRKFQVHWTEGLVWHDNGGQAHTCKKRYDIEDIYPQDYSRCKVPKYSSDPAASMALIKHMTKTWHLFCLGNVTQRPNWRVHTAAAQTLELAVALAALDRENVDPPA